MGQKEQCDEHDQYNLMIHTECFKTVYEISCKEP